MGLFESKRERSLRHLAAERGWDYVGGDVCVLAGTYRGRRFGCIERSIRVAHGPPVGSYHRQYSSRFMVALPAPAPATRVEPFLIRRRGRFGRLAARVGRSRITILDEEFNSRFRVTSDDWRFATRMLQPGLVRALLATRPCGWEFDDQDMLMKWPFRLEVADVQFRLDFMCDVLDRVPADVWWLPPEPRQP